MPEHDISRRPRQLGDPDPDAAHDGSLVHQDSQATLPVPWLPDFREPRVLF